MASLNLPRHRAKEASCSVFASNPNISTAVQRPCRSAVMRRSHGGHEDLRWDAWNWLAAENLDLSELGWALQVLCARGQFNLPPWRTGRSGRSGLARNERRRASELEGPRTCRCLLDSHERGKEDENSHGAWRMRRTDTQWPLTAFWPARIHCEVDGCTRLIVAVQDSSSNSGLRQNLPFAAAIRSAVRHHRSAMSARETRAR